MKNRKTKEDVSIFFEVLDNTSQESKNYVSKCLEIAHQIDLLLQDKGINQKKLAELLTKSEAEVSKWLSGSHNFTIRTLSSIGTVLGDEVIITPWKIRRRPLKYTSKIYKASPNSNESSMIEKEKYGIKREKNSNSELKAA